MFMIMFLKNIKKIKTGNTENIIVNNLDLINKLLYLFILIKLRAVCAES